MELYIEDISENINDGFTWLSVINGMEPYRVQLMTSSSDSVGKKVIHVYDYNDNELDDEELKNKIEKESEKWANEEIK